MDYLLSEDSENKTRRKEIYTWERELRFTIIYPPDRQREKHVYGAGETIRDTSHMLDRRTSEREWPDAHV